MAKKKKKLPMWKLLGLPGPLHVYRNRPRLYRIWEMMRIRGGVRAEKYFMRQKDYKYYTHVTVCEEWREFPPFWFWAHLTGYRDDLTIDRKDWRKGHTPDNCRWATLSEQNKNRHYSDAFREACRRNWQKALAAQKAMREARNQG